MGNFCKYFGARRGSADIGGGGGGDYSSAEQRTENDATLTVRAEETPSPIKATIHRSLLQNVSERLEETRDNSVTVRDEAVTVRVTITPHSFAFVPMGLRAANITRRRNSSSDEDEVSLFVEL